MSELNDLYQETILEHNKNPRNFREIEGADKEADGNNPLCGDALRVYVKMDGDTVSDVAFKGSGCAISKASASMMTQTVQGKTREEAEVCDGRNGERGEHGADRQHDERPDPLGPVRGQQARELRRHARAKALWHLHGAEPREQAVEHAAHRRHP